MRKEQFSKNAPTIDVEDVIDRTNTTDEDYYPVDSAGETNI